MYDRILVPTDGSPPAETATETAITVAQRFGAALHAMHVIELGDLPYDIGAAAKRELTQPAEALLSTIEASADDAGVEVTTELVQTSGPIHDELLEYANEHDVDLIVMGTNGRTGFDRLVIGSVTERTLRLSPIPVLTVHEDASFDPDVETVLVPTDGSDPAEAAANRAIALAEANGAALHVVHVVDVTATWGDLDSGAVLEALETAGQRAVDRVIDLADEADLRAVEASVLTGTPARAIAQYAADRDVDLIVIGTHGRTGLDRYVLGSVTEKVVRTSTAPVLAVSGEVHDER